jgi:SAM-dependent methyltransferase
MSASPSTRLTPAAWLTSNRPLLPASGEALDVACGRGRHALWLAERGFRTHAIDRDADAVAAVRDEAAARGLTIAAEVHDLESGAPGLPVEAFDVIVVVHYLHRPLFPHLLAALRPGGVLVYETFTTAQAQRGKPSNPAFLLEPGELVGRVTGQWRDERADVRLDVLAAREGDYDGRMVASVVARRP